MWVLLFCALATAQLCDDECSRILGDVNAERQKAGAPPVCIDSYLMRAAMVQAQYQNSINDMTHTGAGGTNVGDRVTTQGYKWTQASENVAMGQTTTAAVMLGWMNSEGHRRNILNPDSQEMGIAHVGKFWAQAFGHPRPGSGGCDVTVPGGPGGTLETKYSDVGPQCDSFCQSVLQVVNQKRAAKGELALCINGKLQNAAQNLARAQSLNRLQEEVDASGFGTKGVGAAEHTIKLSRGLPTDQNILDMLTKDYQGSGNGKNFTRGGIASDARREFWVIIEAATYTPDVDQCQSATGGLSVANSLGASSFASTSISSFPSATTASLALTSKPLTSAPAFSATTTPSFTSPSFSSFASTTNPSFASTNTPSFASTNTPSLASTNTPSFSAAFSADSSLTAAATATFPRTSLAPPLAASCSTFTSACKCTGRCGWSSSAGNCQTASATVFTDCTECSSQVQCQSQCSRYVTACQCATVNGCGWQSSTQKCSAGAETDCNECPSKAGCGSSAGR